MRLNLYIADQDYCKFLHDIDNKVSIPYQSKEARPYVGILITVNNKNYFAPLTSPKLKHQYMKDSQDFLRIKDGLYGAINFNNMIPIPKCYLQKIDISKIEDKAYAKILEIQLEWINSNKSKIINRALNLYYAITQENASDMLRKRCCNFLLLEEKCYEYMNSNYIREEELIYCYV